MNADELPDESLFEGALKCCTAAERSAYLDQKCLGKPELRQRIEVLLQAHERSGEFLEPAPVDRPTLKLQSTPEEAPGTSIGRYKLLQKIGEGGMGVVYMAEQTEPVVRKVALKIIKLGMDTREVVARFEAERQALALMDHPNIAKVLDAGETETGRPYFVMELVRGVPITEYCDKNKLSAKARLELFIAVCQAVQHAHQKGIIHRDLKPSNVMVTLHDGQPVPRVIDFGVAKATNQRLTEKTLFTHYAQMIGTPAYMSPEQAEMSGLDVDTRADVYSLGVLLYELLTGATPFDAKKLLSKGFAEMQRIIAQEEPLKPSTRMSTMQNEECTVVATNRSVDAVELRRIVQGDLDWIVMKCLEKDRSRRYETANGLASDIQRHLKNEPINARPPSAIYTLQKLARRNRLAFATAGAVFVALLLGIVATSWQAIRASAAEREQKRLRLQSEASEREAKTEALRSERVSKFFQDMLSGVGPSVAHGRDTTLIREILEKTVRNLSEELKEEPSVEVQLRNVVADVYQQLGDLSQAETMVRGALSLRPRLSGGEHREVARSLEILGHILCDRHDLAQAEALYLETLAIRRRLFGDTHNNVAASLANLGNILYNREDYVGAVSRYREAMDIERRVGDDPGLTGLNMAVAYGQKGDRAEAEKLFRQHLEIVRQKKGDEDPDVALFQEQFGLFLSEDGKLAEAEELLRTASATNRKVLGSAHAQSIRCLEKLAHVLKLRGDLKGQEATYREVVAIYRGSPGNDLNLAGALLKLSTLQELRTRYAERASLLRESLAIHERLQGRESKQAAEVLAYLGTVLGDAGDFVQEERFTREALAIRQKLFSANPYPDLGRVFALNNLGFALIKQKKLPEAEKALREVFDVLQRSPSANPDGWSQPLANIFELFFQQEKFSELELFLNTGLDTVTNSAVKALYLDVFGTMHARRGHWVEALTQYKRRLELDPENHEYYHDLAPLLVQVRDLNEYRRICQMEVGRFRETTDPKIAERMARDCLLLPNSGVDPKVIAAWVELGLNHGNIGNDFAKAGLTKALVEYRQGHFAEAIEWLKKAPPRSGDEYWDLKVNSILAMAQHQSGRSDAAQTLLAATIEMEKKLPKLENRKLGNNWTHWIYAKTLFSEAQTLIEGENESSKSAVKTISTIQEAKP